jgi:PTH2 family peptidyl-tRNA hydrolase
MEKWTWEGTKKICVKVKDEAGLIEVQKMANNLGLPSYLVADAGHTQVAAGSLTVCGIGPADSAHIDLITKDKKLL